MGKKIFIMIIIGIFFAIIFLGILYHFSFKLNGNKNIELSYGNEYKELGYNANILSISLKKYVKVSGKVDSNKLGTYKVIYQLPFKTITREVKVLDKEKPNLELIGEEKVIISVGSDYIETGYKVSDNYDENLNDKVEVTSNLDKNKLGKYYIKYKAKDSSNNETIKTREIDVIDNIKPVITLKGLNNIIVKQNNTYQDEGFKAFDNYDGDITNKVKVSNNIDFSKIGNYEIIYEVSDSSKNKTIIKRIINVIENINITYIKGILLVNKNYHLPSDYNPGVNSEAYNALLKLQNDAQNNGYSLPLLSGFRSYETQKILFNSYVLKDGEKLASTYSARPGESEHQTGLAFDVGQINDNFGNTNAGIWLNDNAHKYGFIIRYLKGKEHITGYKYEPWHIRYIGVKPATEIYNQSITLEEYLGVV